MRALDIWTSVSSWRWTPTVGLSIAALLYVLFAIWLIPDHIGAAPGRSEMVPERVSSNAHLSSTQSTVAAADFSPSADVGSSDLTPRARRNLRRRERQESALAKRGFSPPLPREEQPVAAPEPAPVDPPPPPPLPPSTQRVEVSPNAPASEPPAAEAPQESAQPAGENAPAASAPPANVAPAADGAGGSAAQPAPSAQ